MPDLQSELKKTLNAWEQDANQYQPDLQPKEQMKMQATFATAARPATPATNNPDAKTSTLPKPVKPADMTLTETVFNYVRDNPGYSQLEYVNVFVAAGFNYGSVTSLVSQFVQARMMNKDINGKLTVAVPAYKTLTSSLRKNKLHKRVVLVKRKPANTDTKQSAGIAALPKPLKKEDFIITKATPEPAPKDNAWSVDSILDTLSVNQARQLRDALNDMFKG